MANKIDIIIKYGNKEQNLISYKINPEVICDVKNYCEISAKKEIISYLAQDVLFSLFATDTETNEWGYDTDKIYTLLFQNNEIRELVLNLQENIKAKMDIIYNPILESNKNEHNT